MNPRYIAQVKLLLDVLPIVAQEKNIAIKGGTAINLFIRELPRLSVDIDLVYLPLEPRTKTIAEISGILDRISDRIKRFISEATIDKKQGKGGEVLKIIVSTPDAVIKIEPNTVLRGTVYPIQKLGLNPRAKENLGYEGFISVPILSVADLYGGKICAALDRQHPRDLFDLMILFENEGLTEEIRKAFLIYLASHDRPMNEVLNPQRLYVKEIFQREFSGMTDRKITYEDLETIRERLIEEIIGSLSQLEKEFLISMKQGTPQWNLLGIEGVEMLPALQWKLINIQKMDNAKRVLMVEKLKTVLKL